MLRGIQAKVRAQARRAGLHRARRARRDEHMHTDLPPAELFRLAQAMAQVEPVARSPPASCRAASAASAAASVVFPDRAMARRLGNDARRDAVISRC